METYVFVAVLFAAFFHAAWNGLVKVGLDPMATATLITFAAGVVALPVLPFVGLPAPESWPWMAGTTVVHLAYFAALIEAYRTGDLGQVYPIARGSAPLMTASATTLFLGEHLSLIGWAGIVVLVSGVFLLSIRGGRDLVAFDRRAVGFALLTSVTICAYSIVDGIGARLAGDPNAYSTWLFIINAITLPAYAFYRGGFGMIPAMAVYWKRGLIGGALQFLSYVIAIWAMTLAPIAIVATLRETSVLFAAAIAVVFLKEPLRLPRIAAALLIVCGLVLIRMQ